MLGKSDALGKWKTANSWQVACNESNAAFTRRACYAELLVKPRTSENLLGISDQQASISLMEGVVVMRGPSEILDSGAWV